MELQGFSTGYRSSSALSLQMRPGSVLCSRGSASFSAAIFRNLLNRVAPSIETSGSPRTQNENSDSHLIYHESQTASHHVVRLLTLRCRHLHQFGSRSVLSLLYQGPASRCVQASLHKRHNWLRIILGGACQLPASTLATFLSYTRALDLSQFLSISSTLHI